MSEEEDLTMKRNDIILIICILLVAGIGLLVFSHYGKMNANIVIVTIDGDVYGTYSLHKDRKILIQDTNIMVIKNGQVDVIEANCPDQICVDHKSISKNKETIVCLPNKVIIEIIGDTQAEFDAIAN